MASVLVRHRTGCVHGQGNYTAPGKNGCSCKPRFYAVSDGKRNKLQATNQRDAERELARLTDKQDEGDDPTRRIGWEPWRTRYLGMFSGRESSKHELEITVDYADKVFAGVKDLRKLMASDVAAFLDHIRKVNKERDKTVSPATLNKHLRNLSSILEAAIGEGYLGRNPVGRLHSSLRPRGARSEPTYFTDSELAKLWLVLSSKMPACTRTHIYKLAACSGMRVGELVALRWSDVDLLTGEVRVERSYSEKSGTVEQPKSGKGRTVDLTPAAQSVLEGWFKLADKRYPTDGDALVFPHPRTQGHLSAANLTRRLYAAMKKAGIPAEGEHGRKRNFHSLRHTFARVALEHGAPIDWVQRQLGHSTITLTVDTYGRWSREAERKQAAQLEGAFAV